MKHIRVIECDDWQIIRPHHSTTYVDAAYCYRPSSVVCLSVGRLVSRSVCLSVCHSNEPCKNGWTDQDAIWFEDSGGAKEPCIRWGAHWRNLANTTEPSMCGSDVAFLSIYFGHLLWPLYGIGQAIVFLPRDFCLLSFFLLLSFLLRLISAVTDWMSTILLHMVGS